MPSEFCKVRARNAQSVLVMQKGKRVIQELYLDAPQIDNYTQIGGKPVYYTGDGGNKTLSPVEACSQLQGFIILLWITGL